ncbi:MAG: LPS assembly lipoprotein LptE [Candidatus Sulfobium sp.]
MSSSQEFFGVPSAISAALGIIIIFLLGGCGYSVHRHASLPFGKINVGRIDNATLEPKLQDKLSNALTEEFTRQGIVVTPDAKLKLTGRVSRFDMISLSEKEEVTLEYRVIVDADFTITDAGGKVLETRHVSSPFIVSFTGPGELTSLLAARDLAEERAMRDLSQELVGMLIYK